MTRPTVVMTGATGLIGAALTQLLARRWCVHAVARRVGLGQDVKWHSYDLSAPCAFNDLPAKADGVVYLAQSEFFRNFPDHGSDIFEVNTGNLLRMLEYARRAGVRHFVLASSGGVYGTGDSRMTEEIQIPAQGGLGFYLSTKICSEILAHNFDRFFAVVILRYFFVYGPGQRQAMLIPRLVQCVRRGQPIQLQGADGIRINPVHVSDAAEATARALELDESQTINVGGPEILTLRQIGNQIGGAVGCEPVFSVDRGAPPGHLAADISRMSEVLAAPRVRFADGIRTMI